ncbi:MAG: hypothetical protein RSC24_14870 [Clostridium sp.]
MKKFLVIALSALMITTVMGCSSKSGETNGTPENAVEENVNMDKIAHFGKVKSILGNELELEIASMEALGIMDEGDEEKDRGEESAAMAMTPATESSTENTEVVSGDANKEKMELEYTGDIENLKIPGGVTIMNLTTGKNSQISDIKDGSVIIIYTDSTSDSISKIEILE